MLVIIIFLITHKVVYYSATKGIPSLRDVFVSCVEADGSHHRASVERTERRFSHCLHARITFHDDKRFQLILIIVVSNRINTRLHLPLLSSMKGMFIKKMLSPELQMSFLISAFSLPLVSGLFPFRLSRKCLLKILVKCRRYPSQERKAKKSLKPSSSTILLLLAAKMF